MYKFRRVIALALISVFTAAAGCGRAPKENEVYIVKEETKKNIEQITDKLNINDTEKFYDIGELDILLDKENIPLTAAKDRKYIYYMSPSIVKSKKEELTIIKGEISRKVDIIKLEVETGKTKRIASDVPFVSRVKWNADGTMLAFLGGSVLTIYNDKDNSLIQSFNSSWGNILNFAWSLDSKKIYLEGENLINDGIYYTDSKKYVHAYETKENLYLKERLDDKYYYGTEGTLDRYETVIADSSLNIVKRLNLKGRIRDSYKLGILQTGEGHFELYYQKDINGDKEPMTISKGYISDAKFTANGGIVYITPNDNPEENNFFLHILDSNGLERKVINISGSRIALSPDGKTGYISGENFEKVDIERAGIERAEITNNNNETENIYRTIRGAVDVLYKYEMMRIKDYDTVKKYFVDTNNPEQWAYTDIVNIFNEGINYSIGSPSFRVRVGIKNLELNGDRATAAVSISARGSNGSGESLVTVMELIKSSGTWYVTGLSTFPDSKQYTEVKSKVEDIIKQAVAGKIFDGVLKDREVKLGQIQFWQLSEPHLADNIEYANYCKIYLKVMEGNEEVLYKLVLDRKKQNYWKESVLSKERLSMLF
jgi:hypothetical protein